MAYYVDIPSPATISEGNEGCWSNVGTFATKEEAVKWIRENIGYCDDDGNICLLTLADVENNVVRCMVG
jgi:hypothetical protein